MCKMMKNENSFGPPQSCCLTWMVILHWLTDIVLNVIIKVNYNEMLPEPKWQAHHTHIRSRHVESLVHSQEDTVIMHKHVRRMALMTIVLSMHAGPFGVCHSLHPKSPSTDRSLRAPCHRLILPCNGCPLGCLCCVVQCLCCSSIYQRQQNKSQTNCCQQLFLSLSVYLALYLSLFPSVGSNRLRS